MLLRRITKHVKDQNWFAVFIDFIIVVVGVLMAFQITEWSQLKAEKKSLIIALERLQEEIQVNLDSIEATSSRHEKIYTAGFELLKLIRSGDYDEIPLKLIAKIFVDGFTTDYSTSALTSVLNQQTFKGLQNSELRPVISSLPAEYLDAREDEITVIQRLDEHWVPYITQKLPVGELWTVAYEGTEWESEFASIPKSNEFDVVSLNDFKEMASSMAFQNEIVNRIAYENLIMVEQKELRIILTNAMKLIELEIK